MDHRHMHSVREFATAHGISRAQVYRLVRAGVGPRLVKVGRRTLISEDAARDWREALERREAGNDR